MKMHVVSVARVVRTEIVVLAESAEAAQAAFDQTSPLTLEAITAQTWNPLSWEAEEAREITTLDELPGELRCFSAEVVGLVDVGSVADARTARACLFRRCGGDVNPIGCVCFGHIPADMAACVRAAYQANSAVRWDGSAESRRRWKAYSAAVEAASEHLGVRALGVTVVPVEDLSQVF